MSLNPIVKLKYWMFKYFNWNYNKIESWFEHLDRLEVNFENNVQKKTSLFRNKKLKDGF